MKKGSLIALFILISSLFYSIAAQAATIRISAPKIQLELAPGETYSGEIVAENPAEEENKVKIYLEDWAYLPCGTGEKKFSPAGTLPLSAAKWITFSPSQDILKPFARISARYTINVPEDAKGAYYSVLFFETILGTQTDEEGVNVLVSGRIGALFFIEIKGTVQRKAQIQSIKIDAPEGNRPMEIETAYLNAGNADIGLGGNFLMMDKDGKVQGRGDLNKIYTFPGDSAKGKSQWVGRLPQGAYDVLLTYDLGKGQTLVEEKTITIS